jgi:hypothetical protein
MLRNRIEGPLNKASLKQFLKSEPSLEYLGESVKTAKGTIKFDGVVLDSITDIKIAIKLKEAEDYLYPIKAMEVDEARWAANKSDYKVIEIPYFIQLTNDSFEHYFGRAPQVPILSDHPSGFEDPSLIPPANFCSMGTSNFLKELGELPGETFGVVYESLLDISFLGNGDPYLTLPIDMLDEEFWEMFDEDDDEEEDEKE